MILNANWPKILKSARLGDLEPARKGRQQDPSGPLADYFYGRALAEAGIELDVAIGYLQRAALAEPKNPVIIQALALALARSGIYTNRAAAAEIWRKEGLPLDLELLGQVALTLEAQTRPWPEASALPDLPWPESMRELETEMRNAECGVRNEDAEPQPENPTQTLPGAQDSQNTDSALSSDRDILTQSPATKKLGFWARRHRGRAAARVEALISKHQAVEALQLSTEMLNKGLESPELHLVSALAAEEAGLALRARAHLARATALEPAMFLARTWLGRIYWRNGWAELALGLWRSLPVEGPYDYGRHYHLALGHDALGDRPAALVAMRLALDRFYFDTRHFHIKQALEAWQRNAECGMRNAE